MSPGERRALDTTVAAACSGRQIPLDRPGGRSVCDDECMEMRERILEVTRNLTIERGVVPSLNAVADAAGVSKGGLIHHFPTRAALVDGLARQALEQVDRAMSAAAGEGRAASAWLRLSVPEGDDLDLFRAMAVAHRAMESPGDETIAAATEAAERWERLIADEVGDPVRARIIRLVGDGLAFNAFAGTDAAPAGDLDRLERSLLGEPTAAGRE
ncbi:TetR family transcriptional regulator [Agromyces luteolus]|uniref:TetR family transcriptional regulator n=2 Tax=Agromyces luteolus TaxID=88373 RepID=A0A7C9LF08_9MICO|nr:TetR family transcriptional regulator [Agromyces luteolus]